MIEVIGVKFKTGGKMYYFAPGDLNPAEGSYVMVETARGPECGEVAARRHAVTEGSITAPLKKILRLATEEDIVRLEQNRARMTEAMRICQERIDSRGLPMRLIDVESSFDSNKLIFYFMSEERVDFRELVKDLSAAFHVRIELRQIGDRDEARLVGGLGICGREFCCKSYLNTFETIGIKMAKEQGLALNPTKISGACGRLMCCLKYESPVYDELMKVTPKTGSTVLLPGDPPVRAYVMEANLITGMLRVKPENADTPISVSRDAVERLTDTSRRMTKEDLRDRRGTQGAAKPAGKPAAKPAQPAQNAPESENKPAEQKSAEQKPRKPKPNKPKPAPKADKPKPEKPFRAPAAAQPAPQAAQPAQPAPAAQPAAQAALYAEFGETHHAKPAAQPVRPPRPAAPADMDFTEHRAPHPHSEGEPANGQKKDFRRPRKPQGQFNRRNNNRPPQQGNHAAGSENGSGDTSQS